MKRDCRGLSLIEVIISAVILFVLVAVVLAILLNSSAHYENQAVLLALDQKGREALNEISKDLRMSKLDLLVNGVTGVSIVPSDATIYSDFQFRLPGKLPAGTRPLEEYRQNPDRLMTQRIRYAWVTDPGETPNDGVDNNNNGVVDEGILQKTEQDLDTSGNVLATRTSRICWDLKKNGLAFKVPSTGSGRVEITVDLEKVDPKNRKTKMTRTVQTTVELRN